MNESALIVMQMLYEDAVCKRDDEAIDKLRRTGEAQEVMEKYKVLSG